MCFNIVSKRVEVICTMLDVNSIKIIAECGIKTDLMFILPKSFKIVFSSSKREVKKYF